MTSATLNSFTYRIIGCLTAFSRTVLFNWSSPLSLAVLIFIVIIHISCSVQHFDQLLSIAISMIELLVIWAHTFE